MRGHIRKRGNKWALVVEPTRQTVGGFLRDWVPAIEATVRAGTWRSYRTNMERHVIPRIGHVPLRQLGPAHLNALYAQLLRSGRHDGNGGLSPRTVRYTHTILHRALRDAVRWGLLSRNPADLADPPRHQRPTLSVWTAEELRTFLRSTGDDRLHALWVTLAMTGLRRGEALALRWADIDFDRRRVSISRSLTSAGGKLTFAEPKTARSRRSLAVDSDTLGELRTHRRRQLEERVAWAGPHDDADLVFARDDGSPLRPDSVSRRFTELAKAAGVPRIRVHDLRHTHATLAVEAGVHPKVVSERLGHSSVAFTLDVYSHVVPALDEEAANRVARLITGA